MGATYAAADVKALIAGTIREVEAGRIDPTTGRTISTLAGQLLKALEAPGAEPRKEEAKDLWRGKPIDKLTEEEILEWCDYNAERWPAAAREWRLDMMKNKSKGLNFYEAAKRRIGELEALTASGAALDAEQGKDLAAARWYVGEYDAREAIYPNPERMLPPDKLNDFADRAQRDLDNLAYHEKERPLTDEKKLRREQARALLEKYPKGPTIHECAAERR